MEQPVKTGPVTFGDVSPVKRKRSRNNMRSSQSKFASKKEPNPWREVYIHEDNLRMALEYALRISTQLKGSEEVERVLVGEPVNGVYPLSVAIIKRKEDRK